MPREPADRLRGTVGDTLVVRTVSGSVLTLTETLTRVSTALVSPEGAQVVAAHVNAQVRADARVRTALRQATTQFNALRRAADKRVGDSQISVRERAWLKRVARRLVRTAISQISDALEKEFALAARREVGRVTNELALRGKVQPTKAEIDAVVSAAVNRAIREPWPGTKASTAGRLRALAARAVARFDEVIDAPSKADRAKAMGRLRRGLHDPKPASVSRVDGGSVGRTIARINRTESTRIAHEVAREIVLAAGDRFVVWRLSPIHRWYGGNEVCEKIAAATGPGVYSALRDAGHNPNFLNTEGVFLANDAPFVPHPNCMCSLEPWHPEYS